MYMETIMTNSKKNDNDCSWKIITHSEDQKDEVTFEVDDIWNVKFPNAVCLSEVIIDELTEKTVVLKVYSKGFITRSNRYKISDIEFVEKIKDGKEK